MNPESTFPNQKTRNDRLVGPSDSLFLSTLDLQTRQSKRWERDRYQQRLERVAWGILIGTVLSFIGAVRRLSSSVYLRGF